MDIGLSTSVYRNYAEQLDSIEESLHTQPITWEQHEQIVQALDDVSDHLLQLETTAANVNRFAQSFLQELRQKAIFLYGEVDDFFYKHEVEVIEHETQSLAQMLQGADVRRVSKIIESLKLHITELLETFSPKLEERRILVFAKLTMERAEALLNGQDIPATDLDELSYLETEEIIQEIAEYLGENNRKELKALWSRLSPAHKKLVMAYLDPKDLFSCFFHEVKRSTNQDKLILG